MHAKALVNCHVREREVIRAPCSMTLGTIHRRIMMKRNNRCFVFRFISLYSLASMIAASLFVWIFLKIGFHFEPGNGLLWRVNELSKILHRQDNDDHSEWKSGCREVSKDHSHCKSCCLSVYTATKKGHRKKRLEEQPTPSPDQSKARSTTNTPTTTPAAITVRRHIIKAPLESIWDRFQVKNYLFGEEQFCREKIKMLSITMNISQSTAAKDWCPCIPPDLHGRVLVNMADDIPWPAISEFVGSDVSAGGEGVPRGCRSHTHLAIVIPCRDRENHLRIFLRHLIPILKRQFVHFRIFVIDQSHPAVFNKAALMNIGFLEAEKRFSFDCVMFHDVDHLLEDDRALMRCGSQPRHYASAIDQWNYELLYTRAFGGVITMTPAMFRQVNGFSSVFFGWGGEDDDMGNRVLRFWEVFRPPLVVSRYSTIKHDRDVGNPRNNIRHYLIQNEIEKYTNASVGYNGLSNLIYAVTNTQIHHLYTWIQASIDESLLPYPSFPKGNYRKVSGACRNPASIMESSDVSIVTCRFRCDTQPCFGFSYQQTTPKCSILRRDCDLSKDSLGMTYIKLSTE